MKIESKKKDWIVTDAVHGILNFKNPEIIKELIDTSYMQRLRYIKQMEFAYLVFPSAEHTRFQHSLGAAYIAGIIASNLGCSREEIKKCEVAALLHDIGMFPFSHTLERGDFGRMYGLSHEDETVNIIKNDIKENGKKELKNIFDKYKLDPEELIDIIKGLHELSPIIKGPIDADKLDYLQRDSYFLGIGVKIDPYVYHMLYMPPEKIKEIYVKEKGVGNVEALFFARYTLRQRVHFHHAIRAASLMLNRAVMDAFSRGKIKIKDLVEMGDEELLNKLRQAGGYAEKLVERLKKRKLYKRVAEFELEKEKDRNKKIAKINDVFATSVSKFRGNPANIVRLESFLANELKLDEDSILVDIPHEDEFKPPERYIKIWESGQTVYDKSEFISRIHQLYIELRKMRI
jgi:HD superfamily phosphohydrolase